MKCSNKALQLFLCHTGRRGMILMKKCKLLPALARRWV